MSGSANQLRFRPWLVKQLLAMRWSAPSGVSIQRVAKTLGVRVDVLREVQRLRNAELPLRGRLRKAGRKRALYRTDHARFRLTMPQVVHRAFKEYVGTLQIGSGALLRSLIHHFLSTGAPRPTTTSGSWHYQGVTYHIARGPMPAADTLLTRGVASALDHYANLWGVTATGIVRGLVTDALEGRVKGRFRIIAFSELWGDPERYLHPEKFL
jgi:hypothetical protein